MPKESFEGDEVAEHVLYFEPSADWLSTLISNGESETVEFTSRIIAGTTAARTIVAFANTKGGVLLVGIGRSRELTGLSEAEADASIQALREISVSLLGHPVETGKIEIKGNIIVYALVQPVPDRNRPIRTAEGEVFVRLKDGRSVRRKPRTASRPAGAQPRRRLFVAMSFREEQEPALVDYFKAIERAVERSERSFQVVRMNLVEGDYEISQRIMEEIRKADVVLADFTLSPANVYFELGFARGATKRTIQTARRGTVLEFDTRNWRTTFYRNATELEELLIAELRAAYRDLA
jgi:hypothetical protein